MYKKDIDKYQQKNCRGHPAIGINTTEFGKKNNDKTKHLSHMECYIYKQKSYHANKYSKKPTN